MSEYAEPLYNIDARMAKKARDYLGAHAMLPDYEKIEANPDARLGLLRHVQNELYKIGTDLSTSLDPTHHHAHRESVLAFGHQRTGDTITQTYDLTKPQVEADVPLWAIFLTEDEKTPPHNFAFIDSAGRIFELTYRHPEAAHNPDHQFLPVEVPVASMTVFEAVSLQKAAQETYKTIIQLRNSS